MPYTEIKLLVEIACYFEKENQVRGIIHKAIIKENEEYKARIAKLPIIDTIKTGDIIINFVDASENLDNVTIFDDIPCGRDKRRGNGNQRNVDGLDVWRMVIVPSHYSFPILHDIIQVRCNGTRRK